ncbi:glycine cleavage system aminomethyltransferase GcvT [Verrucomicrobiales bacterium]|nr:glycine cleavage system aminomethyltransferase GcvT [Verrucomicrobiales bacterium]
MLRSPLHDKHLELGARIVPFAGWEMPIQYAGIVAEHHSVRNEVGVFDISHMGELEIAGKEAESFLNRLLTNDVSALSDNEGQYTLMLNDEGGVIDDLILYRLDHDRYFLVVNASKIEEDVAWISSQLVPDISLTDHSEVYGGIAVQGPEAIALWESLEPELPLPERNGISESADGTILCRTGYTGEDGFELFDSVDRIDDWFARIIEAGATPCGLGARDTLRLEKGYPLNGSDLDETHTPHEAGLGFFVKLEKVAGFIGSEALAAQKEKGLPSRLVALRLSGKAPPLRQGYEVSDPSSGAILGTLCSGSLSPTLGVGIGMAYLPVSFAAVGNHFSILIRGREFPAEIVKKPFV